MFPPPWTTRHDVGGGSKDILALARKFQDLEKQQSSPGPRLSTQPVATSRTRLLKQHSHRCFRRKRIGRAPDEYHFNITTRDWEHDASPPSTELLQGQSVVDTDGLGIVPSQACTTTSPLECSALGAPPTPSLYFDQTARVSRLSHPKRIPKCGVVSANGARRLFGQTALLPLHSRARARARVEATLSAVPEVQRTETYGRRGKRSPNDDSRNRLSGLRRTASNGVADDRRTAWDDQQESGSVLEYARNVLNSRRGQGDPAQPLTPQSRSDEGSSRGRTLSEDSISTQALVYGHRWRGQPPAEASSGLFSDDRNEGPSGYEEIRKAFFDKFREVANKKQSDPDENVSSIEEESVRALAWRPIQDVDADADTSMDPVEEATSKFLRQLNDHGRAPWPALLKLSRQTRALEMGGMGLGDDLMAALAMVMPILRSVERLVAFDNRMTDFSLFRVVLAVQGMPSLTHLDLSENKIGALAAHELREYMRSSRCKLRSLAIRKADIDDDECREFMAALVVNVSLLEVDLTENLIGMAAASKVTGADSIAAMLSVNCTLTSLNLGWNSIRMASAVTVAESLRDNHTLLSLGLAYNSFSDYASQILAVALSQNDTLTSLDLSYNSVSPAAAIVLAFALKANTTLKFVELEGNRIGRNGGEALVMAMRTSTRSDGNLIVSVKNCDTSYNDETLLNVANATGEYTLDLQTPYQKAVAAELLILANRKPTAHFVSLKHVTGKRVTNVKLRREKNAVETLDPGAASTRRIKKWLASGGRIEMGHFTEYARAVELKPEPAVASKLVQIWNEVLAAKSTGAASNGDPYGGDLVARSFFESVFRFADKDDKGELVVNDLKMLFQALGLPYGNARIRHVMTKYDADHSGSVDVEEFTHYMTATHIKQRLAEHGVLCTDDKSEWRVPDTGILRVHFVEEPNDDRTLGEMSTDCGVEGLIINIRQSPSDDSRKRLFELATANSRTYFTASQAQGLLEAISSNYHLIDAVAILMPQLASTQECAAFIDSNLDHRAKVKLRFIVGGAWGAMMGMPSAHYALDMQSPRDRLTASKMAAVANHERQHSQFSERVDTSQHGNWHNFRNAEYKREPVVLTSGWFVDLPKYGVLRFDYVSTSRPDHHQMPLPERRFQRMLARLGLSTPITPTTPVDEDIITADALLEACTSHWRKMASSSPLYKIDMRDYFRSGSALDDVSLASWWSVVEVKSVDLDRKNSFAHLEPSDTYVKAWYKLKELEVALCSACLTTDQLARILESFPREGQIRAEVVVTFYHKVTDIDQMCLLVDALRPDESREVFTRRGFLNVTNPFFADRYYRLDLSVWDDREMAKILIRLAMMEPGENWIDETYERKIELGPLPGWELPLDWTTPDITSDKKEGGPRRFGILTLWYASTPRLGCMPNLGVRQDLAKRTLCSRADRDLSSSGDEAAVFDIVAHTFRQQQRFRSMLDKARQGMILLADEIAIGFTKDVPGVDGEGSTGPDTALTYCPTATSSLTEVGEEGELAHAWGFPADVQSF